MVSSGRDVKTWAGASTGAAAVWAGAFGATERSRVAARSDVRGFGVSCADLAGRAGRADGASTGTSGAGAGAAVVVGAACGAITASVSATGLAAGAISAADSMAGS